MATILQRSPDFSTTRCIIKANFLGLHPYRTASSGNTVLGLRFYARTSDKITLRQQTQGTAKPRHAVRADFYNGYPCDLKVSAYVRLDGPSRTVTSPSVSLPSRSWQRGTQFEIDLEKQLAKARGKNDGTRDRRINIRERGFVISVPKRAKYAAVLVDNVSAN